VSFDSHKFAEYTTSSRTYQRLRSFLSFSTGHAVSRAFPLVTWFPRFFAGYLFAHISPRFPRVTWFRARTFIPSN